MKKVMATLRRTACVGTFAVGSLFIVDPGISAADDRAVLRDRLEFLYVANPNATPAQAPMTLNNTDIAAGNEREAFWSNAAIPGLHVLVRALLSDTSHGGDGNLQFYAAKVISITPGDRRVRIYLYDDITQPFNTTGRASWGGCIEADGHAWPCAQDVDHPRYAGMMWLGSYYFENNKQASASSPAQQYRRPLSTFIHESVHTQDKTDGRPHIFTAGGINYRYGADGRHYGVEVIPNMAMTYKEGIANAVRLMYDPSSETRYFNIFATNDLLFVEKAAPPVGSGISPDAWLYSRLQALRVPEESLTTAQRSQFTADIVNNYAAYRVRNLPAPILAHNEYVLALIIAKYMQHVDPRRFFTAIQSVNAQLYRASGSGIAVLFETLGNLGLPDGTTVRQLASAPVSMPGGEEHKHLLPLAYADYFTGYRAASVTEFGQIFEGLLPEAWLRMYWDTFRQAVRTAAPITSARVPQGGDLTSIAIALGINSSSPDR
jgi:hypothetical protein